MANDSNKKQELLLAEYVGRINRAMDFVHKNIDRELALDDVARAAGFSKFHFHRIFKSVAGETLSHFLKRIRVEKAAAQLSGNPHKTITAIALDCGFSGSTTFARAFKEIFGMSASEWREGKSSNQRNLGNTKSNICKPIRNIGEEFSLQVSDHGWQSTNPTWRIQMTRQKIQSKEEQANVLDAQIEIKEMPDFKVVYVRHVGPYQGDGALFGRLIGKLCGWAGPRGLMGPNSKMLMVYHDDPNITDDEKLRVDVCLTVDRDVEVDGEFGTSTIPGGAFAVGHFEIDEDQYGDAWNAVMVGFLPKSGYQPDDRLCYEMCLNDPQKHPLKKSIVDICVPVRPL